MPKLDIFCLTKTMTLFSLLSYFENSNKFDITSKVDKVALVAEDLTEATPRLVKSISIYIAIIFNL